MTPSNPTLQHSAPAAAIVLLAKCHNWLSSLNFEPRDRIKVFCSPNSRNGKRKYKTFLEFWFKLSLSLSLCVGRYKIGTFSNSLSLTARLFYYRRNIKLGPSRHKGGSRISVSIFFFFFLEPIWDLFKAQFDRETDWVLVQQKEREFA